MKKVFSLSTLLCTYAICACTPYIYSYYLIVPCVIGLLFFLLTLNKISSIHKLAKFAMLFLIVAYVYRVVGLSTASWGNYGNKFLTFISVWAGIYACQYFSRAQYKQIVYILFLCMAINIVDSIRIQDLYPELNTTLKTLDVYADQYGMLNVGGTEFSYCVLFLAIYLFIIIRTNKNVYGRYRIISFEFVLWVLCSYFIFAYGNSATVLLTYIITIFLLYINSNKNEDHTFKVFGLAVGTVLVLTIFHFFANDIVELVRLLSGDKVAKRFETITHIFGGESDLDDQNIMARIPMILLDLDTWVANIKNFIIGSGYNRYDAESLMQAAMKNGAGGHSDIFDIIAEYGLVGLFFLTLIIIRFKHFLNIYINNKRLLGCVLFSVVASSIFNVIFYYHTMFIIMVLAGYMEKIQNHNTRKI